MSLWRYNEITGYWVYVRSVTEDTAADWLRIFQADKPGATFKVAARKPRSTP